MKRLLADPTGRIRLEDFINAQLRDAIAKFSSEEFTTQKGLGIEGEFERRLKAYEAIIEPLQTTVLLLAKWAGPDQVSLLERIFARLAEAERVNVSGRSDG